MKAVNRFGVWSPFVGALALGLCAFSLGLEGAPDSKNSGGGDRQARQDVKSSEAAADVAVMPSAKLQAGAAGKQAPGSARSNEGYHVQRAGRLPRDAKIPVAPPVTVNPFTDEPSLMRARGELIGPWRLPQVSVAGGSCSFDIDCDDCDDCTTDRCDIQAFDPLGSGTCLHNDVPDGGGANACSDGLFCNGIETCKLPNRCLGTCNGGINNGLPCQNSSQCGGGVCANRICDDGPNVGQACTGKPFCNPGVTKTSCELPGQGTGVSANTQFQIPCEGVCVGGTSNEQRCDLGAPVCPGGGTCVAAVCDEDENECKAPCTQRICSPTSSNADKACDDNGDCPGGTCLTPNQVCDDELFCTGTDTCVGSLCVHTGNPCGPDADCSELLCPGTSEIACNSDADCLNDNPLTIDCIPRGKAGCFFGRCCDATIGGEFAPSIKRFQTAPNGPGTQKCPVDDTWYSTEDGGLPSSQGQLPVCPKYSGGVAPPDDLDYEGLVVVGPVSQATAPCNPLKALGDDYCFSNATNCALGLGSYIAVEELVFVGGVETVAEERIEFSFYSASGEFIEEFFFASGSGIARRTINIDPPVVIPPTGRIIARVATAFSPTARIFWASTPIEDIGSNDESFVYTDTGAGIQVNSNFIGWCMGGPFNLEYCNPANGNTDCEPGGTCTIMNHILAFELAGDKANDPVGACCDDGPTCDGRRPWECDGVGGVYLGAGQLCARCSNDSPNAGGACRVCAAGTNAGLACDQNSDCPSSTCASNDGRCRVCSGGSRDTFPCEDPAIGIEGCPGGACVAPGTCDLNTACTTGACCITATGTCVTGHTPGTCTAASGTFQGFGTDCSPNCCTQPGAAPFTGGDDCVDATPHVITTLPCTDDNIDEHLECGIGGVCQFDALYNSNVCYITITGNNNGATGPDSCTDVQFDPNQSAVEDVDPGWWETLSVPDCVFTRWDFCCSNPVHAPQWVIMWDKCPCGTLGAVTYFNNENPNPPLDAFPANNRGSPFCDDDNLWFQYGPIPGPASYYQPVYSSLAGAHGAYQMHVTVAACPKAACCYTACSNSTNTVCTTDANCSGGEECVPNSTDTGRNCKKICDLNADCGAGTCNPLCGKMHILDCDDINGIFQAPPRRPTATTVCAAQCATGSCCITAGVCEDESTGPVPMTKSLCDSAGGSYIGGIKCFGGVCCGGGRDGLSCIDNTECPGGTCNDDCVPPLDPPLAQVSPCPICDIADDAHCQNSPVNDFAGTTFISDESVGGADPAGTSRIADDFVADEGGTVNTVCVIGNYIAFDIDPTGDNCDDRLPLNPDHFTVSIYEADPDVENALPGTLLGTSSTMVVAKALEFTDQLNFYRYKLSLNSPIGGLLQGRTYFLEVYNDTTAAPEACNWFWFNAAEGEGNNYFMQDLGRHYGPEDAALSTAGRPDAAFCLNLANSPPPEHVRACCSCAAGGAAGGDPNCTDSTFFECAFELKQRWLFEQLECANFTCPNVNAPVNDECAGAIGLALGDNIVSNQCATDSPSPLDFVDCGGTTPTEFRRDVWHTFTAPAECAGLAVTFDLCDLDNGSQDTLLAVYGGNDNSCPCPATVGEQNGDCSDDDCFWSGSGSSLVFPNAVVGNCYLVRVAGFFDVDGAGFSNLNLQVSCGNVAPPDATAGDDTCFNGNTNLGTPCSSNADCTSPAVCGLKSRYLAVTPGIDGTTAFKIKVTILTMPQFPTRVGQMWWAGAPAPLSNPPGAALTKSLLVCNKPDAAVIAWPAGTLYLYGTAIVPNATYQVQMCDETNTNCSLPLVVGTSIWGNVVSPHNAANFADISAVVDKFRNLATAPSMPRADLVGTGNPGQPSTPNQTANFADVSAAVDAFRTFPYGFTVPACP